MDEKYRHFLLKFGYWASVFLMLLLFLRYLFPHLLPFLIAFGAAALLQPAVRFLSSRLKIKARAVGGILILLFCLVLTGLLLFAFAGLTSSIVDLVKALPGYFSDTITPALNQVGAHLAKLLSQFGAPATEAVNNVLPEILSAISSAVTRFSVNVVTWASGIAVKLPNALLSTVICVIAAVFFTIDYQNITGFLKKHLPQKAVAIWAEAFRALKGILGNYLKSYFLIFLITFGEIALGLWIIGIKNAFLIALLIAAFDILPVVGSGLVLIPWTLIAFLQGNLFTGIALGALYLIVAIARQILEPRIIGKNVGLHPLAALLCMWVGVKTLGGVGLFGLPIGVLIVKQLIEGGIIGKKEADDKTKTQHLTPK